MFSILMQVREAISMVNGLVSVILYDGRFICDKIVILLRSDTSKISIPFAFCNKNSILELY